MTNRKLFRFSIRHILFLVLPIAAFFAGYSTNRAQFSNLVNKERASATALESLSGPRSSTVLTGNLRNENLSGHSLANVRIENADLRGADLSVCSLYGCHISNSDLSGANLEGSNLSGTHLDSVDLQNADLGAAVCSNAHFGHVDMRGAKMYDGNFNAHFDDCHLEGAVMTNSVFKGAENSTYDSSTKFPVGFSATEYNNDFADDPEFVGLVPQ